MIFWRFLTTPGPVENVQFWPKFSSLVFSQQSWPLTPKIPKMTLELYCNTFSHESQLSENQWFLEIFDHPGPVENVQFGPKFSSLVFSQQSWPLTPKIPKMTLELYCNTFSHESQLSENQWFLEILTTPDLSKISKLGQNFQIWFFHSKVDRSLPKYPKWL